MKIFSLITLLAGLATVSSAHASPRAHIAVANRAGGTITLAGLEAEPMYISQVALPAGELRGCGGS